MIDGAFSNMQMEADDEQDAVNITAQPCFPQKCGVIMKCKQWAMQEKTNAVPKVGIEVCRHFFPAII